MHVILSHRIQAGESVWRILNGNRIAPLIFVNTNHHIVDGKVVAIGIHGTVLGVGPSEGVLACRDIEAVVVPSAYLSTIGELFNTIDGEDALVIQV